MTSSNAFSWKKKNHWSLLSGDRASSWLVNDLALNHCLPSHIYITWHQWVNRHSLTHWGRLTHICVSKLTIIGSDNGLLPERHQAIIWTNAGILLNGPLGTNFSEILIEILTFSFTKMHLKMSEMASILSRPQCVKGLSKRWEATQAKYVLNQCPGQCLHWILTLEGPKMVQNLVGHIELYNLIYENLPLIFGSWIKLNVMSMFSAL